MRYLAEEVHDEGQRQADKDDEHGVHVRILVGVLDDAIDKRLLQMRGVSDRGATL